MGRMVYLLGILITILAGTYFHILCCNNCGTAILVEQPMTEREAVALAEPVATAYPVAFSDVDLIYDTGDNFNFSASSSECIE